MRLLNIMLAQLIAVICLLLPAAATPNQISVGLFRAHPHIREASIEGPIEVTVPKHLSVRASRLTLSADHGRVRLAIVGGHGPVLRGGHDQESALLLAPSIRFRAYGAYTSIAVDGSPPRSYAGEIIAGATIDGLCLTNNVDARSYIKSVVGSESNPDFPLEQLKAQSVLAQTLLARYKSGDVLPDTTEKQAYLGTQYVRQSVSQAVDATWGESLVYQNSPVLIYYHSTCGGGTSNGEEYFELPRGSAPYLSGINCSFCKESPFWKSKQVTIPVEVWKKSLGSGHVAVVKMDAQGRPLKVQLGDRQQSGYQFWMAMGQKLGWDKVPGTRYQMSQDADGNITVASNGAGHGVGLCQWGASGLARAGKNYKDILQFYFPGTTVRAAR